MVSIGDPLQVKVIEIDAQGRINLSHRQTLPGQENVPAEPFTSRPPRNGGGRFGGGGGDRGRPRAGERGGERGGRFEGGQRRY